MFYLKNTKFIYFNPKKIVSKWIIITSSRASYSTVPQKKIFSHTILFPKTNFPARTDNSKKLEIEKVAQFSELYNWQRENLKGPSYVLHDGPPYANGDLHIGHTVNKIIKDIVNRCQVLQGRQVHYVPGWDCHGLPIELKALQKARKQSGERGHEPTDPIEIRQVARKFALETVEKQKKTFKEWGVMADWSQCYLTLNKEYVKSQLKLFYKMYQKGLITRSLKPVYWSVSSRTALAEAELEYDPNYKSTQVYVKFPLSEVPGFLSDVCKSKKIYALIWTTTPWTLMANRAICYNPTIEYSLVSIGSGEELFIVANGLTETLEKILDKKITKVLQFSGSQLQSTRYSHPVSGCSHQFLAGRHVAGDAGTGLVHTAPAHGPDDFLVALEHSIDVECNVDESGCYTNVHPSLDGLPVLSSGQESILNLLGESVIHKGVLTHSYPKDWRTKQPVIVRASQQWFIHTADIKKKALDALTNISIMPSFTADQSRHNFKAQLENRPYWCVSRQRAWGVPIPVVYDGERHVMDERIVDRLCSLIDKHDTDVWWTRDVQEFVSDDVKDDYQLNGKQITKGKDIMDIWLDSGLSWHTLPGVQAEVYSEGVDQLTGWFQASLLTSLALNNRAPYKSIFVHGFVVDHKKRKMSKSIGNVIDPQTIIYGGEDLKANPAYGIDTLRWWVASHATQHSQIIISKKLMDDCHNEVSRIRNLLKYLLGVISDVPKQNFNKEVQLNYFDKYFLKENQEFSHQAFNNLNSFKYNLVCQALLHFLSNKVSAFYCHCVKDKLYCSEKESEDRLSTQLVLHTVLMSICKVLAPILPHLVEEVWLHHPLYKKPFHFTQNIPVLTVDNVNDDLMKLILDIKKDVIRLAKNNNLKKMDATLKVRADIFEQLSNLNIKSENDSVLCEILELSSVDLEVLEVSDKSWDVQLSMSKYNQCVRCRKYNLKDDRDLCLRCDTVITSVTKQK